MSDPDHEAGGGSAGAAGFAGPAVTVAAVLVVLAAWWNLDLLRGTFLWELRYVAFLVVAVLVLTAAEWIAARLAALVGGGGRSAH